jgi:hypothetical protein
MRQLGHGFNELASASGSTGFDRLVLTGRVFADQGWRSRTKIRKQLCRVISERFRVARDILLRAAARWSSWQYVRHRGQVITHDRHGGSVLS